MKERRKECSTMEASSSSSGRCEFIDEAVLFQILLRLPVSSLMRFKSVCKPWLSLIESPVFISQHTDRSNLEGNQENKLICLNSFIKVISVIDLQLSNQVDIKPRSERYFSDVTLIASFNGIVCLAYLLNYGEWVKEGRVVEDASVPVDRHFDEYLDVVSLWNPATKHVKILPSDTRLVTIPGYEFPDLPHYGFGFDNKTKDYRVVRVFPDLTLNSQVEVYSLNTDSWRVINVVVPLRISIYASSKRPFRRNDVYYWLGVEYISEYPVILSFDFSNEVFGIIPMDAVFGIMPGPAECRHGHILASLRERLACVHWVPDPSGSENFHCNIWMLDTCGVHESWTKLYTVILEPWVSPLRFSVNGKLRVCPLGFSVNGKMVLKKKESRSEAHLLLFDPDRQEFNDTPFNGTFSEVIVYKESLVSVKGGNGETYGKDFSLIEFN